MPTRKLIVGIGGTLRAGSSTEACIQRVLKYAKEFGAETRLFSGQAIDFPIYAPGREQQLSQVTELLTSLRTADGIVIGSPGYHGGISGLVKNALDYTEGMAKDAKPYFSGKRIGCVATGSGWQGCNATLQALRNVVHSLRGWPTPLGIAVNTKEPAFNKDGEALAAELDLQLRLMARQVMAFDD
jgi:FMN reductase